MDVWAVAEVAKRDRIVANLLFMVRIYLVVRKFIYILVKPNVYLYLS